MNKFSWAYTAWVSPKLVPKQSQILIQLIVLTLNKKKKNEITILFSLKCYIY